MLKNSFQPLYKQAYDVFTDRLVSSYWRAGDALPSEFNLADELGVSQGTVRKALNQMVSEKLLERRQGKGTFVAEHTNEGSLFRFFRIRENANVATLPETQVLSTKRRAATKQETKKLNVNSKDKVSELLRVRYINEKPAIVEKVIQPLSVFPDIDKIENFPNALYILYQERYGINIVSVRDKLKGVSLPKEYANLLKTKEGTVALMIERESISMDGGTVELSCAYCNSDNFFYYAEIN